MKALILHAVRDSPGIHFRELQRDVSCSVNTLDHHLRNVEQIEDRQIRGYRRLFPRHISEDLHSPLAALNHDQRGQILYIVGERPDIISSNIASALDTPQSSISDHLTVLRTADLIHAEKDGRKRRYTISEKTGSVIDRFGRKILDEITDGFIDMWD
jgi:DNA-binding transcriptional ArsR family regulator